AEMPARPPPQTPQQLRQDELRVRCPALMQLLSLAEAAQSNDEASAREAPIRTSEVLGLFGGGSDFQSERLEKSQTGVATVIGSVRALYPMAAALGV
ncbi:unnamed protein product, partial [Polarella glacialis]